MPWAILTPDGRIRNVFKKPDPMDSACRMADGERMVRYDPPEIDHEMQTMSMVQPVDPAGQAVEFVVQDKPLEVVLPILKKRKWDEIKARRERVEFGGFEWDGSVFDSDDVSQRRIQGALQLAGMAGPGYTLDWTLKDNSARTLSAQDLVAVGVALGQHVAACHEHGRALRDQINAAQTVQELAAVAW